MDFETFMQSLFAFLKNSDNLYFLLYALATSAVTQVVKKLCVNKVDVDVKHKFDYAVVLPFVIATLFAAVDLFVVQRKPLVFVSVTTLFVNAATIGALSTVVFKFVSSIGGQSLKTLLKDDVFGVFYTQLLYFGTVRQQLNDGTLSFVDFVDQVKLVAANAKQIYADETTTDESKRASLAKLLGGIVCDSDVNLCANVINRALIEQNIVCQNQQNK